MTRMANSPLWKCSCRKKWKREGGTKIGRSSDRFGDYLCVGCANLLCASKRNQFTKTKFT